MKRMIQILGLALLAAIPALALAGTAYEGAQLGFMPEVISESGRKTDHLYSVIMWIVIVIFLITEGMLLLSVILFRDRPGHKAVFTHGSTKVEVVLAIIPALILAYVTVQSGIFWNDLKLVRPRDKDAVHVQVLAEQFSWNYRYAGADAAFGTADDVTAFEMAPLPVGRTIIFHISSKDVIHSFFIPEARGKQDAMPGLLTRMWFKLDRLPIWNTKTNSRELVEEKEYLEKEVAVSGYEFKSKVKPGKGTPFQVASSEMIGLKDYYYEKNGEPVKATKGGKAVKLSGEPSHIAHYYEIGCAQLCGTSHFAMRGRVSVMPGAEFDAWLASQSPDASLNEVWAKVWDHHHPDFNRI